MPDGVDAPMRPMEGAEANAGGDRCPVQATRPQVGEGDHPVLLGRECCHPPIAPGVEFVRAGLTNSTVAQKRGQSRASRRADGCPYMPSSARLCAETRAVGLDADARATYSPLRVSTRTRSPSLTNRGTWIVTPDSSVAGL
jgi:hypothetical protein